MSGPSIYLTVPDRSLFKFPPDDLPPALPPPSDERTWKSPFPISHEVYNRALDAKVPLTIAGTYVVTVLVVNAINRRRGNKPWWISQTRAFKVFVILHNLLLAAYSAVTFYAMLRAVQATWPGFDNSNGLAGVADSLCKVHGPRGLGDAAFFNATSNVWETKNALIKLLPEGTPDPTDVGRLWNEGLAFWGWFFYLSKFYEVVDTAIIVAKGKRSATLQTYHHAGAMLCMWAGIRYMSPPIWMFVFINSFIHALMYTYYTLSAIGVRVPNALKRTLTTMQIAQFLFGATFAAAHLFVKYDIPISTAYTILHPISSAVAQASSTLSSAVSAASPTESYGAILRRILLRAAGDEGVAENVRDKQGNFIMEEAKEAIQKYHQETRYRNDYRTIDCIDTTGESFAIWLNIFYLAPLTVLFIRFFIRAYLYRSNAPKSRTKRHSASRATIEAAKGVNREVDEVGKAAEKTLNAAEKAAEKTINAAAKTAEKTTNAAGKTADKTTNAAEKAANVAEKAVNVAGEKAGAAEKMINDSVEDIYAELKKDIEAVKRGNFNPRANRPVSERVQSYERKATPTKKDSQKIKQEAADTIDELKDGINKENSPIKDSGYLASGKDNAPDSPNAPSTPSKKKKRKNKKKKQAAITDGAENADEHTDAAESGSEQEHHEPDSYASALRDNLKEEGAKQDVKEEPEADTA